ncbi:putative membrane protein [Corynebacterium mustelae]|uniref:Fluoride-specific ion channel FluC n=1 Tax=Corynebacterium mustelae TaxID=571915 RepID=A0A0G3H4T6_9CORY|nr:CrcB family protein [Corynebacterium mustelae]AKK06843.1 putative membrane protein [Corynebacterium mustelae]
MVFVAAAGAAAGAGCRFILHQNSLFDAPTSVLLINVLGSFLFATVPSEPTWLRPLVCSGFLGGFTSFSTFLVLAVSHTIIGAAIYTLITVTSCLAAWLAGTELMRRWK